MNILVTQITLLIDRNHEKPFQKMTACTHILHLNILVCNAMKFFEFLLILFGFDSIRCDTLLQFYSVLVARYLQALGHGTIRVKRKLLFNVAPDYHGLGS